MEARIGAVCAQTGLSPKQVRDWERHGIIHTRRGVGNQRLYDATMIERLRRAKRMHDAGLALADVRYALAVLDGTDPGGEAKAVAQVRLVLARIRSELELADELADAVAQRLSRKPAAAART